MRTTLTLDDDVAAELRRYRESRGVTWRTAVNEVLRAGLARQDRAQPAVEGTLTRPRNLGEPLLSSLDDISEVIDAAEGTAGR